MKKYKKLIKILKAFDMSRSIKLGAIKNYDDWKKFIDDIDRNIDSKNWLWLINEVEYLENGNKKIRSHKDNSK